MNFILIWHRYWWLQRDGRRGGSHQQEDLQSTWEVYLPGPRSLLPVIRHFLYPGYPVRAEVWGRHCPPVAVGAVVLFHLLFLVRGASEGHLHSPLSGSLGEKDRRHRWCDSQWAKVWHVQRASEGTCTFPEFLWQLSLVRYLFYIN